MYWPRISSSLGVLCVLAIGACEADGDDPPGTGTSPGSSTMASLPSTSGSTGAPDGTPDGTPDGSSTADPDDDTSSTAPSTGSEDCLPAAGEPVVEDLELMSADGTTLTATSARPAQGRCLPAVLLIHQYALDRSQWDAYLPTLVGAGYAALAIDLRGHGGSGPIMGETNDIFVDPDQAPQDVSAGLAWLAASDHVDPERMAAVGTSIGANLSVVALHHQEVRAAVSLSPRLDPTTQLAGAPDALVVGDLFCLAGENDGGGQAQTCTDLVAAGSMQSQLQIFEGTAAHGVEIPAQFPRTEGQIIDWLGEVL